MAAQNTVCVFAFFVADTKIILVYNFVAPLNTSSCILFHNKRFLTKFKRLDQVD